MSRRIPLLVATVAEAQAIELVQASDTDSLDVTSSGDRPLESPIVLAPRGQIRLGVLLRTARGAVVRGGADSLRWRSQGSGLARLWVTAGENPAWVTVEAVTSGTGLLEAEIGSARLAVPVSIQ